MKQFALFFLLLISFTLVAQDEEDGLTVQAEDDMNHEFDISDWRSNLKLGLISTYYIDFATSPVSFAQQYVGMQPDPNDPNNTIPRYASVPYQSMSTSFFSVGIEPRYNVFEYGDNLAAAVSVPMTIGLGQTRAASINVNGVNGFGSIQIPFLARLYLGSAATSRSEENFGVNLGVGYEMNKIALIALDASEEEINANKAWFMPTAALGVNFYRGRSPMEVNVKYGFGKVQTIDVNGAGGSIQGGSRDLRASSIKLSLIYLIN